MTEPVMKTIPNGGTRLRIWITLQAFVSLLLVLDLAELITGVAFEAWVDFTVWNFGIYAGTEAMRKGAEGYMNK